MVIHVCSMNSFLFTDDIVSDNYHNNGKMNFVTTLMLSVLSNLIGKIISFIFVKLAKFAIYFDAIEQEVKNEKDFVNVCRKVIPLVRVKLFFFFVLEYIVFACFFYYVTIFCIVYRNNQIKWISDCITRICVSIILSFVICVIGSMIKVIGIKNQSKVLYNISIYINE